MKELIDRTISRIFVSDDQHILAFETDGGVISFVAEGDCCSESWFADLTGFDALIGGKVVGVEEVGMEGYNTDDGRGRQESDQVYGYKIRTDRGYATVVFRNSSNGFYGGELYLGPKELPEHCVEVVDDWAA